MRVESPSRSDIKPDTRQAAPAAGPAGPTLHNPPEAQQHRPRAWGALAGWGAASIGYRFARAVGLQIRRGIVYPRGSAVGPVLSRWAAWAVGIVGRCCRVGPWAAWAVGPVLSR